MPSNDAVERAFRPSVTSDTVPNMPSAVDVACVQVDVGFSAEPRRWMRVTAQVQTLRLVPLCREPMAELSAELGGSLATR